MRRFLCMAAFLSAGAACGVLLGQGRQGFIQSFDNPAIDYPDGARTDAASELIRKIDSGALRLAFEPGGGYLRSVLDALHIAADSQVAVFSQTSFQATRINLKNPRAVFFNDQAAVGWVRGGNIEIAAQDPVRGVMFYELRQAPGGTPRFTRTNQCLQCHVSWDTLGVPGFTLLSTGPPDPAGYATGGEIDHHTPFARRWGGWYVTGHPGGMAHMGNVPEAVPEDKRPRAPVVLDSLTGQFDLSGYLAPYSDIVALMVLGHQSRMMNLITWIGWEARIADARATAPAAVLAGGALAAGDDAGRVGAIARALVDYLLFVDEAPLTGRIEGSSGFAQRFAGEGPRDSHGRSLRQFDLERRMMRYPCSYMVYSPAFDALPASAKRAVYDRMSVVLSGQEPAPKYGRLSPADRRAVVEILRETKRDLPAGFGGGTAP